MSSSATPGQPPAAMSPGRTKSKATGTRRDRVGATRGKYRPREKPATGKEIMQASRVSKPKAPKKRATKKIKEIPRAPLISLPFEVLDLIIGHILPSSHLLADYLPHPTETPYPPTFHNVTSSLKARSERWGVVPQSVIDIIQFGRCCRQTREAVERAVGGLGGSYPRAQLAEAFGSQSPDVSASPSLSNGEEADKPDGRRQLYLRVEHCDRLVAIMSRSRATLEHVVFYSCGSEHGTTHDSGQRDWSNASPINRTPPLQYNQPPGRIPLPRLRSLQIGPDVCGECIQACLHLLTGRTYYSRSEDGQRGWVLTRLYGGYGNWAGETFESVAAPALEAIQIHLPLSSSKSRSHFGSSYASAYERVIDPELRNNIKIFSLILPNMDRKWGGFGVAGFTSSVHQKSKEAIEKELAERAKVYLTTSASSKRQKGKPSAASKVLEKYALQAKAALAQKASATSVGHAATNAVAAALVSTIKPKAEVTGGITRSAIIKDADAKVANGASDVGQVDAAKTVDPTAEGKIEVATPTEEKDEEKAADSGDPGGSADKPPANTSNPTSTSQDTSPPSSASTPQVGAANADPTADTTKRSHRAGKDSSVTEYDKQTLANRVRLHQNFPLLLKDIADTFPNLVSLQVLRKGATRNDIVEGLLPLEEYAAVYVTPLRKLHKLEHLDLGLAIVGKREVRDFPLALSLFEPVPGMNPIEIREVEIRRKLYEADVARATKEGDAWRLKVLERFALGRRDGDAEEDDASDDEDGYQIPPANLASMTTDTAVTRLPKGWPVGVRSGFIYSMDLEQRARSRGILNTWSKRMKEGEGKDKLSTEGIIIAKSLITL